MRTFVWLLVRLAFPLALVACDRDAIVPSAPSAPRFHDPRQTLIVAGSSAGTIQLDAGHGFVCALRPDQAVTCWGNNYEGQITGTPIQFEGFFEGDYSIFGAVYTHPGPFRAMSAGDDYVCGVRTDNEVQCWGGMPFDEETIPSGPLTAISAASDHACALRPDATLVCWGENLAGQLNAPSGTFTDVASAGGFNCAIRVDGTLTCWGTGTQVSVLNPPAGTYTQVEAGNSSACAISSQGALTCWGWDRFGQVSGNTDHINTDEFAYAVYTQPGTFKQVSAGDVTQCAIRTSGELWCWGLTGTPPAGSYVNVATFGGIKCAVRPDGVVDCWGHDEYGQATPPPELYVPLPGATPAGANVEVTPTDQSTGDPAPVGITFESVTGAGTTTVTSSTLGAPGSPPPPAGFQLSGTQLYFDIETTAAFTGAATVCLSYSDADVANESLLRLLHRADGGAWEDITTSHDIAVNRICGATTSFSPFLVAQRYWDFAGFFQPVDNVGVFNRTKAGSAIPVKFTLGGNQGLAVLMSGFPKSQEVPCPIGAAVEVIETTVPATASSLSFSASANQYTFVWKTDAAWAGQCRKFLLGLSDGSSREALFHFTK